MSAPVPLNAPEIEFTRSGLLAAAGAVLATCAVAVTLAVAGGGTAADPQTAELDAATPKDRHGSMERRR
jgi:hypothetical protein